PPRASNARYHARARRSSRRPLLDGGDEPVALAGLDVLDAHPRLAVRPWGKHDETDGGRAGRHLEATEQLVADAISARAGPQRGIGGGGGERLAGWGVGGGGRHGGPRGCGGPGGGGPPRG